MKLWKGTFDSTFNSPVFVLAPDFYIALKKIEKLQNKETGPIRAIEFEEDIDA